MLEKVIENWTSRLDYIRASRGSPMPEIIFKIKTSERHIEIAWMGHPSTPALLPRPGAIELLPLRTNGAFARIEALQ
ncbi:hypothetical protein TNCV_2397611 [Trichonephila clavipes]|uniref:Uncharacterized protein n=1 Tax=Trichonephila clavipes TaxID=2585209 RepID=A0A8X6SVF4_TRICX|nr:hypothetical protein TNCV_2397611 [Trichonephila clavipes]